MRLPNKTPPTLNAELVSPGGGVEKLARAHDTRYRTQLRIMIETDPTGNKKNNNSIEPTLPRHFATFSALALIQHSANSEAIGKADFGGGSSVCFFARRIFFLYLSL